MRSSARLWRSCLELRGGIDSARHQRLGSPAARFAPGEDDQGGAGPRHLARKKPIVSIITHGEILALTRQWKWGPKKIARVDELVSSLVIADIRPHAVVEQYAAISAFCQAKGKAVGQNDRWIAATASVHGATVMTTGNDFDALDPTFLKRNDYPQDG